MRASLINLPMNMRVPLCMKHFHYTNVMKLTKVIMIYTRFVNSMTQIAQAECILPLEQPDDEVKGEEYEFMPDPAAVLDALLPKIFRNYRI